MASGENENFQFFSARTLSKQVPTWLLALSPDWNIPFFLPFMLGSLRHVYGGFNSTGDLGFVFQVLCLFSNFHDLPKGMFLFFPLFQATKKHGEQIVFYKTRPHSLLFWLGGACTRTTGWGSTGCRRFRRGRRCLRVLGARRHLGSRGRAGHGLYGAHNGRIEGSHPALRHETAHAGWLGKVTGRGGFGD